MSSRPDSPTAIGNVRRVLPQAFLELPLTQLRLPDELDQQLAGRGLLTIADALECAPERLSDEQAGGLRDALERAMTDGLRQFASATTSDWTTLRAQLLGPLSDGDRRVLVAAVGLNEPVQSRPALQQLLGDAELDDCLQGIRATLMEHCPALMTRLQDEVAREFASFDGVLLPTHAAEGSLIRLIGEGCDDDELGLRLAAFCLPHRCHLHRGALHGIAPRVFRELLRALPPLVPQHLLPLPIDALLEQLAERGAEVPRGVLMHVLRTELRTAIELDGEHGEVAVPDPLKPAARLIEILTELGEPTTLTDLTFAYRERFRFASPSRLLRHLGEDAAFVRLGPERWSLRQWHEQRIEQLGDLVEQTARRISTADARVDVLELLTGEHDQETAWLVLELLRDDPRVRMLGRGEACAADLKQSSVMKRMQRAFRRAAGDVVKSLFIRNQPESQRRLVTRLLEHNRAFVAPGPDRIDTLTNYPFNAERMQRLIKHVREQLQKRAGYAQAEALKDLIDETDLGGKWLSPELLADILRRNGPFEVLAPNIVALEDLALPRILARS
ncbi:MAG: hypothetical protein KAI24_13295, partial [Planctomycetes bacterium]|nr:hypothetical protein [Planctomycetota bacterium]